jgi:hypothetical protein
MLMATPSLLGGGGSRIHLLPKRIFVPAIDITDSSSYPYGIPIPGSWLCYD